MHLTAEGTSAPTASAPTEVPPASAWCAGFGGENHVREIVEKYPDAVIVLDADRRIRLANLEALGLFRQQSLACVLGKRPGEVLVCVHASETAEGCGATGSCGHCGLNGTILGSQRRKEKITGDCCIVSTTDGATLYEIRTTVAPLELPQGSMSLVVLKDISAEKQHRVLERLFFHDVLNTVSGLCGLANALESESLDSEEERLYRGWLVELTTNLEDEIQHHRALLLAERGEYQCHLAQVPLGPLLRDLGTLYGRHQSAAGRRVRLDDPGDLTVVTDAALLRRVLANLIKNAIEATPTSGTIRLAVTETAGGVSFAIQNPGEIPEEVAAHLFHRFFSTKGGHGRGLGTYSAKLFSEKYLKGKLDFQTGPETGTVFTLTIPRDLALQPAD